MKYVAYFLGALGVLTVIAIVLYGIVQVYNAVTTNPANAWVAVVGLGIVAIALIVAVVEYLTDQRKPTEPEL